jgi:low temperature requirement protein LtrA
MSSTASTPTAAPGGDRQLRLRYGAIGLVIGIIWVAHGGEPAWEHALRALVLVLVAAPLLHLAGRRRSATAPGAAHLSVARLVAVKLLLVAVAFVADWGLGHWTSASSAIVAFGLVAGLAAAGPYLHRLLIVRADTGTIHPTRARA